MESHLTVTGSYDSFESAAASSQPQAPPAETLQASQDAQVVQYVTTQEDAYEQQMIEAVDRTPYELEWVEISPPNTLLIDEYQRPFSPSDVNRIVTEFNPSLLGVIVLNIRSDDRAANPRNDGRRYIVDGQHRVLAQLRRGVTRMFAQIFRGLTFEEEAWLFHELNNRRRALPPGAKFKSRVMAGDLVALEIRNMVQQLGLRLSYGPTKTDGRTIVAVHSLERLWRESPGMLRRVLLFIKEVWPNDPDAWRYSMIEGVGRFLQLYGSDVDMTNLKEKAKALTAHTVIARALDWKRSLGGATSAQVAEVILLEYNRGKRTGTVRSKYRG